MLFAVEGGGFFSSSASGYSKGLTLLLLGHKNESKPMRVIPWTQYQLVDQELTTDLDPQLDSAKNRIVRGCASFGCFRSATAGLDSPNNLKVGPTQNKELLTGNTVLDESKDHHAQAIDCVVDDITISSDSKIFSLKSNLKKAPVGLPVSDDDTGGEHEVFCEKMNDVSCQLDKKVQWTDATGGELFEIREFEMSEQGSDNEFDNGNEKSCLCTIM